MELTKLFMNNLKFSSSSSVKEKTGLVSNSNDKFEKCLNNVSSKNDVSGNYEKQIPKEKVQSCNGEKKADSDKGVYDEQDNSKVEQYDESLNKTNNSGSTDKTEKKETLKCKEELSEKEAEVTEEVANALGISAEEVQKVLEQLNINVFELAEPDKLLSFMQEVFNADSPVELLAVDGIKEMLIQVKDIVGEFEDLGRQVRAMREENLPADNFVESAEMQNVISEEVPSENLNVDSSISSNLNKNVTDGKESTLNVNSSDGQKDLSETQQVVRNSDSSALNEDSLGQSAFQQSTAGNMEYSNESQIDMRTDINISSMENVTKAFANVMSKTESLRNVNTADVINQIVEKLKAGVIKEDVSEIKITLKPEYLGDVSLKILSENGIISAQFTAENQRIKEIIESNFNQLRDMLNDQGLQISQLSVSVGNKDSKEAAQQFYFEQEKSGRRISNIINGISEEAVSDEEAAQYIDEGAVLEANINYTA